MLKSTIYVKYRAVNTMGSAIDMPDNLRYAGMYPIQIWNKHSDYQRAGQVMISTPVNDERYVATLDVIGPDGIPTGGKVLKDSRLAVFAFYPELVDRENLVKSIERSFGMCSAEVMTMEEARAFVRANTDLEEDENEPGKFLVSPETEFGGQTVAAQYLVID